MELLTFQLIALYFNFIMIMIYRFTFTQKLNFRLINFCTATNDVEISGLLRIAAQENVDVSSQKSWLSIWTLGRYDTDFTRATLWVNRISSLSGT